MTKIYLRYATRDQAASWFRELPSSIRLASCSTSEEVETAQLVMTGREAEATPHLLLAITFMGLSLAGMHPTFDVIR